MTVRVNIKDGYDKMEFDFDNEDAAMLFAGTAMKHIVGGNYLNDEPHTIQVMIETIKTEKANKEKED